ncbi:hypothetical protein WMY93_022907 [Mugilogobius chulae]|uniref:HTH CENPB-type domain-containing protein n=1 Tax=Mugilogobius chulae TaxID=88201 RepID=A0AAW0N9M6_9GOBI
MRLCGFKLNSMRPEVTSASQRTTTGEDDNEPKQPPVLSKINLKYVLYNDPPKISLKIKHHNNPLKFNNRLKRPPVLNRISQQTNGLRRQTNMAARPQQNRSHRQSCVFHQRPAQQTESENNSDSIMQTLQKGNRQLKEDLRILEQQQRTNSSTQDYKLQIVTYATENGNRAAERKFGVSEKLVRDWRKAEATLTTMKKTKKANRGLKARWPELEERVHKWVLEQRAAGRGLSTVQLRLHARVLAKEMDIDEFVGRPSWCYRFMQRKSLSIRARTTMSQKVPADFQAIVDSFREFVEKQVNEHNITPDHIINMDKV